MNESSVQLTDEVVRDTTERINRVAESFFEEPTELLNRFEVLEELLNGHEAERVVKSIAEQIGKYTNSTQMLLKSSTPCVTTSRP